jgi:hypothetical protein
MLSEQSLEFALFCRTDAELLAMLGDAPVSGARDANLAVVL